MPGRTKSQVRPFSDNRLFSVYQRLFSVYQNEAAGIKLKIGLREFPEILLSLDFSLVTLLPPVVNPAKASYKKEYLNMPRCLHQGKESKNQFPRATN